MKFFRNDGRILETRLAERMMYTVIRRGGVINASDEEGVRSVLADAAENFSKTPGFVSEKKVAAEVARRLQKNAAGMRGANRFGKR